MKNTSLSYQIDTSQKTETLNSLKDKNPVQQPFHAREYQQKLIREILEEFSRNRGVVLQLATGAGKTIIFGLLALEFLKQGEGVLVLAHRKELISQAHEKLEAISGLPAGKIQAGKAITWEYDVQIASIQTLNRRETYPYAGLVIVDECHHATARSYDKILNAYPNAYILGVSATPCRTDGQGLQKHFGEIVQGPSVSELINQGYLSPFRLFAAQSKVDTSGVKTKRGEYDQGQLADAVDESIVAGDVVETWRQYAEGTQTIVFNVDVDHSLEVCDSFNEAGIPCAHIDGKTPQDERDRLIEQFKNKEIRVLTNCAIFTEGFDAPGVETIQIIKPTKSLILWLQMLGRGLRIFPGKDHARIIDHTDNWQKLGLPDDEHEWSLEPKSLKKGSAFAQECPNCNHVFRPLHHETKEPARRVLGNNSQLIDLYRLQCPACLNSFEVTFGEGSEGGGEPQVLTKDESAQVQEISLDTQEWAIQEFEELKADQEATGKRKGWIYFRLIESEHAPLFNLGDWRYFAKRLGYKPGWAYYKHQEVQAQAQGGDSDG